jgi:hypothetical protein
MSRQARLDLPGALHHIMVRAINKQNRQKYHSHYSGRMREDEDKPRGTEEKGQPCPGERGKNANRPDGARGRELIYAP